MSSPGVHDGQLTGTITKMSDADLRDFGYEATVEDLEDASAYVAVDTPASVLDDASTKAPDYVVANKPATASLPRRTRRTRFVLISDTHGEVPREEIPDGDVLIHARGLSKDGDYKDLYRTLMWMNERGFEKIIFIAGINDVTLDKYFCEDSTRNEHISQERRDQASGGMIGMMTGFGQGIVYLHHSSETVQLHDPTGPRTTFKIFGSPYGPGVPTRAFSYIRNNLTQAERLYHRDAFWAPGCETLRRAIWQVRPRLMVCGRTLERRGAERVHWRLESDRPYFEVGRSEEPLMENEREEDYLDMTSNPLLNDGGTEPSPPDNDKTVFDDGDKIPPSVEELWLHFTDPGSPPIVSLKDREEAALLPSRMGRKETLFVNAGIKVESREGVTYNDPIVIDIELPIGKKYL
ncbi:hypothetical protein E4T39_05575 [Aureobasidium subglaciale]|nr:hypothetical protein E4T39_05575 [Aureobasidium subglaciale]